MQYTTRTNVDQSPGDGRTYDMHMLPDQLSALEPQSLIILALPPPINVYCVFCKPELRSKTPENQIILPNYGAAIFVKPMTHADAAQHQVNARINRTYHDCMTASPPPIILATALGKSMKEHPFQRRLTNLPKLPCFLGRQRTAPTWGVGTGSSGIQRHAVAARLKPTVTPGIRSIRNVWYTAAPSCMLGR